MMGKMTEEGGHPVVEPSDRLYLYSSQILFRYMHIDYYLYT